MSEFAAFESRFDLGVLPRISARHARTVQSLAMGQLRNRVEERRRNRQPRLQAESNRYRALFGGYASRTIKPGLHNFVLLVALPEEADIDDLYVGASVRKREFRQWGMRLRFHETSDEMGSSVATTYSFEWDKRDCVGVRTITSSMGGQITPNLIKTALVLPELHTEGTISHTPLEPQHFAEITERLATLPPDVPRELPERIAA